MAKRNRNVNADKVARWIDEGRGQGHGPQYKAWLTIQDVPSTGLATRLLGVKVPRIFHLMSKLERSYFYLFEWSDAILDIREQYPLLPLAETLVLAEKCGVYHPPKSKEPVPMTTDFLLTTDGTSTGSLYAIAIKPSTALSTPRVLEKLDIERRYWENRGVPWQILTERELPLVVVRNIEFLRKYVHINQRVELPADRIAEVAAWLTNSIARHDDALRTIAAHCDAAMGVHPGSSLAIAYHLLATKHWHVNMTVAIDPGRPLELVPPSQAYTISVGGRP